MGSSPKLTAELRWFFDHPIPFDEVFASFSVSEPTERQDHYLLGSGECLGVKWREGNVEIKQQQGEAEVFAEQAVAGYLEQWTKWSFALEDKQALSFDSHWLAIIKRRRLLTFAYDAHRHTVSPVTESQGENLCTLEYTHLTVAEGDYYTLGLEAAGEPALIKSSLVQTIAYLSERVHFEKLGLAQRNSSNYARWIQHRFTSTL